MMRKVLAVVGLFLVLTGGGSAQDWSAVYKRVVEKNVVRVEGTNSFCSGVVIATNLVLTAAHCLHKERGFYPIVLSDRWDAKRELSEVAVGDVVNVDLALLTGNTSTYLPIKLAKESPSPGTPVAAVGYSSRSRDIYLGVITGHVGMLYAGEGGNRVVIDTPLRHGYSGGPLINLNGELVGINVESNQTQGFAIPIEDIRIFLAGTKK